MNSTTSFLEFIIQNGVATYSQEEITLRSGQKSNYYVNWRTVAEDVFLIDQLATYLIKFLEQNDVSFDCIYGVPEGATKLGIITQYKWAMKQKSLHSGSHCLSMGRIKPKEHGALQDRFFLGVPRGRIVVVEDVVTTGGALLETLANLKPLVKEITVVVLTDRSLNDHVRNLIEAEGCRYLAMSTLSEIKGLLKKE